MNLPSFPKVFTSLLYNEHVIGHCNFSPLSSVSPPISSSLPSLPSLIPLMIQAQLNANQTNSFRNIDHSEKEIFNLPKKISAEVRPDKECPADMFRGRDGTFLPTWILKTKRAKLFPHQLEILKKEFECNNYLTKEKKEVLASKGRLNKTDIMQKGREGGV